MIRVDEGSDHLWYPYAGFDWYIEKELSISMLFPWPAINYAPTRDEIYRFGALFSGSEAVIDTNDEVLLNSFSKVDFGASYEKRLTKLLWLEMGAGYSGFGRYSVNTDSDLQFEANVSKEPFIRFAINIRPE